MLYEIICDKFIHGDGTSRGPITFSSGLNVIQGHDSGSNSIGKSTFLLVIDFAFGGDDYANQQTIQREIKSHDIKFCFVFDNVFYHFMRNTSDPKVVKTCNENYIPTGETYKIDDFRNLLFSLYKIPLKHITFRDIVGRYFRIYGRENSNERLPLAAVPQESGSNSIIALLKLYDCFDSLAVAFENYEAKRKYREALSKAAHFNIVKKINKKTYKENLKLLEQLEIELEHLASRGRDELLELNPDQAEQAAELKSQHELLIKQKRRLWAQYYAVKSAAQIRRPATEDEFIELSTYFPNSDLRKLSEIEKFHSQLSSILESEFSASISLILSQINEISRQISSLENLMKDIDLPSRVSRATLDSYANMRRQVEKLKNENENYDLQIQLKKEVADKKSTYDSLFLQQVSSLQVKINDKMESLNNEIYCGKFKAPVLNFSSTSAYTFKTPDDDGTGTNYKNLIVLDLAALELTHLPALAHDTIIFKHIDSTYMGNIINLYEKSGKQSFIAFDRTTTYDGVKEFIDSRTVISLSDGDELYGRSWVKKG